MRSISKASSERNLIRGKSSENKPFAPIKRRSSDSGPSSSYKLSSKVKSILSMELKSSASTSADTRTCSLDDSFLQSGNRHRRFQRRGSKSASMFKTFLSAETLDIPSSLFERDRSPQRMPVDTNHVFLPSVLEIPSDSARTRFSDLGESSNSMSMCEEFTSEEFAE
eukprot:CAMPEP_0197184242 /NCGR_PEP_ID=MMETSP1423-20130617/9532_1 /TAXON_ID=476441 /ORGANISM="Pseudo-nitzschia heimii, Strain UNC1101" /LENGTH=166 /DNA_ID=CAMNT_0042635017 /DNA_START=48 /DNA_END=548 /DNA_ORIENTATION=+